MPVSGKRYTELRFALSDLMQMRNWPALFEACGTSDLDESRTIALIFSNMFDPKNVWKFIDYVTKLSSVSRKYSRDSTTTVCYTLGRMGQSYIKKTLSALRIFLNDDHMLKGAVTAALSNMWVLRTKETRGILLRSWIEGNEENDDLQEVAVRSCEFLLSREPRSVKIFLKKVSSLAERSPQYRSSGEVAKELISRYSLLEGKAKNRSLQSRRKHNK